MEYKDDSGKDNMKSETQDGCENQNDDSVRDRISQLPDDTLHHILSYLLQKDIVRTCVLSSRWRSLWTLFNIVTFDFDSRNDPQRLMGLVERSELPVPDNARIRRFRVYLDTYMGFSCLENVLSAMESISKAVKHHQFEELDLNFHNLEWKFSLPHTLFTCQSLTSLKLSFNNSTVKNTNLSSISLHRLKTLHLKYMTFLDKSFVEQLFDGCLVLEDLLLDNCSWNTTSYTTSDITIAFPRLQRLSIILNQNPSDYTLIIHCPNLKFFKFLSSCWIFNLVLDLPSLVKAYIGISLTRRPEIDPENNIQLAHTLELFERIRGVESLRLSFETLQTICYVEDVLADELPTFHNLSRLKLLGGYSDFSASGLLQILHKSPKLQSIAFPHKLKLKNGDVKSDFLKDGVPECLIHSLERFRVSDFRGNDAEVLLLRQILKHASVLKLFSVRCIGKLSQYQERKEKIRLELKQLCREHCEFSFI